jgi:hypothetical protein
MDIHGWRYTSFFFCFSVCVDSMRAHPHTSPTNIQETNWCHTMLLAVNGISEKVGVNLLFETYTLILVQSIHLPESTKANTFSLRIARIQKDMQASSEHTNEWALTVRSTHYSKNDGPLGAHESMIHQRGSVKLKKNERTALDANLEGALPHLWKRPLKMKSVTIKSTTLRRWHTDVSRLHWHAQHPRKEGKLEGNTAVQAGRIQHSHRVNHPLTQICYSLLEIITTIERHWTTKQAKVEHP